MKCLLLSRYGRKGASSRLRYFQYIPYLETNGISITHHALLDDDYLQRAYEGRSPDLIRLGFSFFDRLKYLVRSKNFDLLWIEKEVFPFLPPWAELWLVGRGIPYVVDYDDAAFHRYDRHSSTRVRRYLGEKIDVVMRNAALVIAANDYLAERARKAGARRIEMLPTAVELERYPMSGMWGNGSFTVGWIGTPITQKYLDGMAPALSRIEGLRFVALGARNVVLPGVNVHVQPWMEATEAHEINKFDVGVMPLPDDDWERGKSGYKLIQYMACGRPVIASPVGANREIVEDGENGFLAASTEDWVDALLELKKSTDLRKEMGAKGRRRVEARYCTAVTAPRLAELLRSAA